MLAIEQFIENHFEIVQTNQQLEVGALFEPLTLKKGEFLLKEGKRCDKFCFLKSGYLRVFDTPNDQEVTQWIVAQGHFGTDFPSFFYGRPSRWTIQALEITELFVLSKENYQKLNIIVPNWPELERTFLIKCLTYMESRIHSFISMSAEERYRMLFASNSEMFNHVPLQYIASMLGMTPETFSRIRKKMSQLNS